MNKPDYERLTREKRKIPDKFELLRLRVHRGISWGKHAQGLIGDVDARFIFFWIAFNALYSRDLRAVNEGQEIKGTLDEIEKYLEDFMPLNSRLIHNLFWKGAVFNACRSLLEDEYLSKARWKSDITDDKSHEWRKKWDKERIDFIEAMFFTEMQQKKEIPEMLTKTIFSRLCILRNQVIHGSATRRSKYNRYALGNAAKVLERTFPIFIELMIKEPSEKWGTPHFLPDGKPPRN